MAALYDAKQGLIRPVVSLSAATRPRIRSPQGSLGRLPRGRMAKTFIENHRDIRPQRLLDLDGRLRGYMVEGAIQMRLKRHAVFRHFAQGREAEDLIAATVGADTPRIPRPFRITVCTQLNRQRRAPVNAGPTASLLRC